MIFCFPLNILFSSENNSNLAANIEIIVTCFSRMVITLSESSFYFTLDVSRLVQSN